MATKQSFFDKFNDKIRISYNEDSKLRDKRDMLLENIRAGIKNYCSDNNIKTLKFKTFNQGSYDLRTGIKPLYNEDHDIDVGIIFQYKRNELSAKDIVELVYNSLQSPNRTVEYMRPCLRVQYHRKDERIYHVDIAIYCEESSYFGDKHFLARSENTGSKKDKYWEDAEPYRLKEIFNEKYPEKSDLEQFRRIVRFLKRWKDEQFSAAGNNRPTGIALTACAYDWYKPNKSYNQEKGKYEYSDLNALISLIDKMINNFNWSGRLKIKLPVKPYNELFEKMTDIQMDNFNKKLKIIKDKLNEAYDAEYTNTFCSPLIDVFGSDFPES